MVPPGRPGWFPTQTPHKSVLAQLTHTAPHLSHRDPGDPSLLRWHGFRPRWTGRVSLPRGMRRRPLPSPGSLGQFPWLNGTMGRSDSRPLISPRFVAFTWRYHPSCPVRSHRLGTAAVGTGSWYAGIPEPEMTVETAGSLRFPSDPRVPAPCSWTPVGPKYARPLRRLGAAPAWVNNGGSREFKISGLDHTASGLAVYASQWRSPATTQDSLPAAG